MKQLFCGASRRCITPPADLLPRLIGLKQHRFAGVLDELYVRAAVFASGDDSLLLLSFDMTKAPLTEAFLDVLAECTQIPKENIFFFAIHTHSVPFNSIDMEERERQTEDTLAASNAYTEFLHQETLLAAQEAIHAKRPSRMGYAFGKSAINVVRLQDYVYTDEKGKPFTVCNLGTDLTKAADRRLFALRAEDMNGEPILLFANYAVHNVATIWNDMDGKGAMGVSSDIGGNVSQMLETAYPRAVAIWSAAPSGDLNPICLNEVYLPDPQNGRTYEYPIEGIDNALLCLKMMSERHYADIHALLGTIVCEETEGDIASTVEWSVTDGVDCIRHRGAPPEFLMGDNVPEHTVPLQMARIGSLTLCGIGAELYSSIGQDMLGVAPENTVLITHNANSLGCCHYILDDETIARCDASAGFAKVPGYDEYRCKAGIMTDDLCRHIQSMERTLRRSTK